MCFRRSLNEWREQKTEGQLEQEKATQQKQIDDLNAKIELLIKMQGQKSKVASD